MLAFAHEELSKLDLIVLTVLILAFLDEMKRYNVSFFYPAAAALERTRDTSSGVVFMLWHSSCSKQLRVFTRAYATRARKLYLEYKETRIILGRSDRGDSAVLKEYVP
ncbi:hypothetical protein BaRGS_00010213 [Batillaria attramentaria]|uniref:Uncharacterized protein n=1 Tax=Batillaria attramentaria TaxID=370345 RepID=A0ABD0LH51_9CAEN